MFCATLWTRRTCSTPARFWGVPPRERGSLPTRVDAPLVNINLSPSRNPNPMQGMTERRKTQTRFLQTSPLLLIAGVAALLFIIWTFIQEPPDGPIPWLQVAIRVMLYAAARFLGIILFGGEFSLGHVVLVSAFLSFDLPITLGIGFFGVIIDQIARSIFHTRMGFEARSVRTTLNAIGIALAGTCFSLGVAALAFRAVGGRTPLADVDLASAVPLITLFVVYCIAATLFGLVSSLYEGRVSLRDWLRQSLRHTLFINLLVLPLSLVIAGIYSRTDFSVFTVFAISLVAFMVLIRVLGVAQAKLEKRVREMATVSAIGQSITNSLDLPELLEAIQRHVGPLMDVSNFYVALYNEDYDELTFPLVYEDGQLARYRSRSASNGLTEYVLRTRAPLLIPADVPGAIKRLGLDVVAGEESQCWLGVPITIGERALGVITAQSQTQTYLYDSDDVDLLSTIASQTAVAIENAQLYASTRRRAAELAILNSVSTAVGSLLKLDQVMDAIVASVGPVVGCQKAAIFLVQEGGRSLTLAAARGLSQTYLDQLPTMMRSARGEGPLALVERQPLIVNDIRLDPRFENFRAAAESEGIRAFADMPLQARDHAIGTLAVYYTELHRFTVAELDLLTTFANQAAVAVSNATLYARTDEALTRRVEELAALGEIGRELTSSLDFNRVIERVLDAAIRSVGATRGLVALYDTDRQALNLVAAHGYPPGALADAATEHWHADQGLIGAAIRDRTAMWIDDVRESQTYHAVDPEIRSALIVPILRDGQPLGIIHLESTSRAAFNQGSASFVGQLSTQAAIAIRNAQLYQQTQNRLREMSILFDVGRQFTSIPDLPDLGRELTRQLSVALDTTHCVLELITAKPDQIEVIAEYAAPGFDPIAPPADPSTSSPLPSVGDFAGQTPSAEFTLSKARPEPSRTLKGVPGVEGLRSGPADALPPPGIDSLPRSRQPIIAYANDARANSPEHTFLRARQLHALIGLPLIAGNQLIGRITWLHSHPRAPFSADEIRFAQTLANQASIALENARLFHERARRIADLSHLYQASLALASSIESDEALNRIALIARQITDSDAVTVYLYDSQTDRVTHGSHLTDSDRPSDASAIRPHGMTQQVITMRQPVLINDTLLEPEMNPRVLEAGIRSVIAMPIIRKDEVLGVLYVNSKTPSKYSADSLQLAQLLANEAAVAIENARLFSQVAQARDRLAAILNSSRDAVLMFDVSGRVIVANPVLEQLWGIHRAQLEGKSLLHLLDRPEPDLAARLGYSPGVLRTLLDQATAGAPVRWDKDTFTLSVVEGPGARPRSIERIGLPVLDESGGLVGWMLVLRDVTEEYELQKMRDDLSNMIIHDLRSPLVAILDSYQLIAEGAPAQPRATLASQALEIGQRSTRKLLDLVNSLLDISRFEHGQMRLDTQFAALRPLADSALEHLAPLANDQGVLIRNDISPELPLVRVEEDQITRVLTNLIDNAVKFSPLGSQVVISARPQANGDGGEPQFVVCSVRDAGPGIPVEHRERIFERFIQLGEGLERRRGTGLGLAFCKLAVEAHGGSIWVEDPPEGAGSQFSFTLPVASLLPPGEAV